MSRPKRIARRFVTINVDLCHQAVEFRRSNRRIETAESGGDYGQRHSYFGGVKAGGTCPKCAAFEQLKAMDEPPLFASGYCEDA